MASVSQSQEEYFQDHSGDNRQGELYATAILTLLLVWTFVGLRFLARWKIGAEYKSDDWLIVAAASTFTAFPIGMLVLNSVGFGKHIVFVTNAQRMVEMVVLCEIAYSITIPLTKLSILSLYNRIFPSTTLYRTSIAIAICTVTYSMALAIVCILQCIPLSTLWNGGGSGHDDDDDGWCMDTTAPYTATAVANVVTDIAVLCLPMPFLYRLRMPAARKLQVVAVFALGGCVCVFGVVRSVEVGTASPVDQSWSTVAGTIWSAVEPCVGIVCACLPTMRGLVPANRNAHTGYTDDDGYDYGNDDDHYDYEYDDDGILEGGVGDSIGGGVRRHRRRRRYGRYSRRFGWTAAGRRRSIPSSLAFGMTLASSTTATATATATASNSKPQVWSTVTSGVRSSINGGDRTITTTNEPDAEELQQQYPLARPDADGGRASHGTDTSAIDIVPIVTAAATTGTTSSLRKVSLSDIHVRTEMHQEVTSADAKG